MIESNNCFEFCYIKLFFLSVKVLRRRRIEDITVDGSLPESLRESWRFVYKPVTVACLCNIYNQEQ